MKLIAEHQLLRQTVRTFVDREINPHAEEWEAAETFPAHARPQPYSRYGAAEQRRHPGPGSATGVRNSAEDI